MLLTLLDALRAQWEAVHRQARCNLMEQPMKRARDPDQIKQAIADRQLTVREMGLLCECSDGTIRFVMAGKSTSPAMARRFARVLRRPLDSLFVDVASSGRQISDEQEAVA